MSTNDERKNVAVWFEIPAANFDRAAKFYETIFAEALKRDQYGKQQMAVFPYERPSVSGCVMEAPDLAGKDAGTVVYLNCDGRLADVAGRVEKAGGKLLTPRIELPAGMGAFFHICDSEGNRVGLHAAA
jgi:predicted enzyme related to lactoylglutathione lyase